MAYLGCEYTLHREDIDLGDASKGRLDLGTYDICTFDIGDLCVDATRTVECALERHVAGRAFGDEKELVRGFKDAIVEGRSDKAVCLAIPIS
jgi:hypothetical protein